MAMYARDDPGTCEVVDRWRDGRSWMAHPTETGRRTSHAVVGDDGVWLFDPLDAPGVDDVVEDLDGRRCGRSSRASVRRR